MWVKKICFLKLNVGSESFHQLFVHSAGLLMTFILKCINFVIHLDGDYIPKDLKNNFKHLLICSQTHYWPHKVGATLSLIPTENINILLCKTLKSLYVLNYESHICLWYSLKINVVQLLGGWEFKRHYWIKPAAVSLKFNFALKSIVLLVNPRRQGYTSVSLSRPHGGEIHPHCSFHFLHGRLAVLIVTLKSPLTLSWS